MAMKGRKMNQKVLHIGIISYEGYKKRSLAIARGEYQPQPDEPKIWFESLQSMAQVLSNENQLLLKTILERKPESLKELEAATGRSSSNLSRTLKTMARYGIVKMEKVRRNIKPIVEATDFTVQFGLYAGGHPENAVNAIRR
jgi:predicted transcriptional regulator